MNLTEDEIKRQACIAAEELFREWQEDIHGANLSIGSYKSMLEENHTIRSKLQEALARRQLTGESMLNAYTDLRLIQLKNKAIESWKNPDKMFEEFDRVSQATAPTTEEPRAILSVVDAMEELIDEKQIKKTDIKQATLDEYRTSAKIFTEITGINSVNDVTFEVAKMFRDTLLKLPKNRNADKYKKLSITEMLDLEVPGSERPSTKTVNGKLTNLKALFDLLSAKDVVPKNPFHNMQLSSNSVSYSAYSDSDLKQMFSSPLFADAQFRKSKKTGSRSNWWLLTLSIYTGARLGELIQLRVQDVMQDDHIYYLSITDEDQDDNENRTLKTRAAKRKIPVHRDLITLGFIDYVNELKTAGARRVLPQIRVPEKQTDSGSRQLKPSHYASKWYGKYQANRIQNIEPSEGSKTFHSFRHTFISRALKCDMDKSKLQQICGHEPSLLGETATYQGDGYSLAQLKSEMDKFKYEGFTRRNITGSWREMDGYS